MQHFSISNWVIQFASSKTACFCLLKRIQCAYVIDWANLELFCVVFNCVWPVSA